MSVKKSENQHNVNKVSPNCGVIEDSDYVHPEIRELGDKVKGVIKQHFQRHGTNEEQIIQGIKQFGVSEQSKKMMSKEKAAALMAINEKIYGVWRNEKACHEINRDFCSRIGPLHKCFCSHTLSEHVPVLLRKGVFLPPKCNTCGCEEYRYVPNEPEEVGDHWLSRRKGFVPGNWFPKCRCGHTTKEHRPSLRNTGCTACGCSQFQSHFLCNCCDAHWEEHETLFESEDERRRAGRSIGEKFIPLSNMDHQVKEIVFGRGLGTEQIKGGGHKIREPIVDLPNKNIENETLPLPCIPECCSSCAQIFKDEKSKFCSKCGAKRISKIM